MTSRQEEYQFTSELYADLCAHRLKPSHPQREHWSYEEYHHHPLPLPPFMVHFPSAGCHSRDHRGTGGWQHVSPHRPESSTQTVSGDTRQMCDVIKIKRGIHQMTD